MENEFKEVTRGKNETGNEMPARKRNFLQRVGDKWETLGTGQKIGVGVGGLGLACLLGFGAKKAYDHFTDCDDEEDEDDMNEIDNRFDD